MPFEGGHVPRRSCSAIRGWTEGVSERASSRHYDSNDGVLHQITLRDKGSLNVTVVTERFHKFYCSAK